MLSTTILNKMQTLARQAAKNAHCVYSDFSVGAVVIGNDEQLYAGCNVESAAYGSSICAECNAISTAIAAGVKSLQGLLIYTPTAEHVFPCGNCRQVLNEFAIDMPVYLSCDTKPNYVTTLKALLPDGFGPHSLNTPLDDEEQAA